MKGTDSLTLIKNMQEPSFFGNSYRKMDIFCSNRADRICPYLDKVNASCVLFGVKLKVVTYKGYEEKNYQRNQICKRAFISDEK